MNIEGIYINYVDLGNKNDEPIVLLHGWGQNIEMMMPIANYYIKSNRVVVIDLPGFGKSEEPKKDFYLIDYVNILNKLFEQLNINNPILIGHSFGGKISLLYASKYKVKKLALLASPYKQEKKDNTLKVRILKSLKKIPLINKLEGFAKKHIGSTDYKNATDVMRKILVNHVNQDLSLEAKKIDCPTLLIWGTKDTAVPLEQAYELEKLIKDSAVIAFPNCTHYAYLENLGGTINIISSFIKE